MHRAVAAWLLRPIAGDGPGDGRCQWGWTQIDDACFKVTQGRQSFEASQAICASMHQNATIASVVNEDQNRAASNLLEHEAAWIGYMVADGSWLDGIHCGYLQDFVEISPSSSCTRLLNAAESDSPKWSQVSCDIIGPALCSYTLQLPRNCSCNSRYEILDGFCNPNDFSSTLCSVQSNIQATNEETCQGVFAPNDMPVYGDWSRETGFAYFHPDGCDETCIQQKCNNDPACKGYTWAIGAVGQFGAGSLKNLITSSQPWQGYECKVKVSTCGGDQTNSAAGNALMMPQVILGLFLLYKETS